MLKTYFNASFSYHSSCFIPSRREQNLLDFFISFFCQEKNEKKKPQEVGPEV